MPVITSGQELPILPFSYSTEALSRARTELASARIAGTEELIRFYLANDHSHACVVRAQADENGRHAVLVKLDFYQKSDCVYTAADFWEDDAYQQVELVACVPQMRDQGLATYLYELSVTIGNLTIISDTEQFEGGKAVWKKLAARGVVDVYIYDAEKNEFYSADGRHLCYDGTNVPDSAIWSNDPNRSKEHILLTASK